jgi:predicted thioredoxin/glutaredoxin
MDAIHIEIIGKDCKNHWLLDNNVFTAIAKLGITARVIHITDSTEIYRRGIIHTPALVINGEVVCQGQIISSKRIQQLLSN